MSRVSSRLNELESGKGSKLFSFAGVTVYEFWIDTPSYSGPIKGAYATVRQTGDIQVVPITTGKSRGGLSGMVFGSQVAGQSGAVVGSILGRQNEVKTETKTIDTRQFDIDIRGPGWAWSTTLGPAKGDDSRKLRDIINLRGSSNEDIRELTSDQRRRHEQCGEGFSSSKDLVLLATKELESSEAEYNSIWKDYVSKRAPLFADAKFRWSRTSKIYQILLVIAVLLPVIAFIVAPIAVLSGHLTTDYAWNVVIIALIYAAAIVYLHLSEIRLIK